MTTFPSGPMTPLAGSRLLEGIDEHLWATSADGAHTFYLKGPFSPIAPGLPGQDGIIIQSVDISAPFKHKDLQGADQDGVTWTETVYDPGMVTLVGEVHAATAQGLTQVWDTWQGMWNPRQPVILEHITNDGGFWYALARLADAWQGAIKQDRRYLYRPFTHKCRIDDAFWRGPDSTDSVPQQFSSFGDVFTSDATGSLSGSWTVGYSGGHTGTVAITHGVGAYWSDSGNSTQSAKCIYATATSTDYQAISIQLSGAQQGFALGPGAYLDIWGRVDSSNNAVVCRIGWTDISIYRVNAGTWTQMFTAPLGVRPLPGEVWTFYVGIDLFNERSFAVSRGSVQILAFEEYDTASVVGSTARKVGFGMATAAGTGGAGMTYPPPVAQFFAADNTQYAQTFYVRLANIGTEDGWPTYTLTGPGTFTIGDGPGNAALITIGPLGYGQVAEVITLPRLRSITDLTSGANLYPLMSGRFRTPIPGVATPSEATPVPIIAAISGGTAASKLVATLTPQRIAPA